MQLFSKEIINWYNTNKRDLPWRNVKDPYIIWLSEILLQQTRVEQGKPYFHKFKQSFPDIHSLANASEIEVLKHWEGLGYYSRARNLHKTAKIISQEFNGVFPDTYDGLLSLNGIGPYTAAAIASFAFERKVAVVDGNVLRVLSRFFGIDDEINSGSGMKKFRELALSILPDRNISTYNQGIMEFGALHCKPANPECNECPLADSCFARKNGLQSKLPVKAKAAAKKDRYFTYLVFYNDKGVWMKERTGKDVWGGLYEFLLIEKSKLCSSKELLKLPALSGICKKGEYQDGKKHILSHQNIHSRFWTFEVGNSKAEKKVLEKEGLSFFTFEESEGKPMPVLIKNFYATFFFS